MNQTVRAELLTMAAEDDHVRTELAADGSLYDGYHPRMAAVHHANAERLTAILDEHGWPTAATVGTQAHDAAWIITQHAIADPALQHRVLTTADGPPARLATLADRIAYFEARPQTYGTQFDWNDDGELRPWTIDDPAHVDERRATVGLPPLDPHPETDGEPPPGDPRIRRAHARVWARSAGWRTPPLTEILEDHVSVAAPQLLGCEITANGVTIRITEVEAYAGQGEDPGSHSHRGRTPRTAPMFGPPGHTYVYFTYGMHWCLNITCAPDGRASGTLIRAGEVIAGHDLARRRRGPKVSDRDLARGPARLAQALAVTGDDTGKPALDGTGPVHLRPPAHPPADFANGPRTGIGGEAATTPWRFWLPGEPTVSPYRPHSPRNRSRTPGGHKPESRA
ncbi:DNA-3-methyladenine glycosylase [Phytomonospora endophytica]|uniref:Putative 3-methyladenine DNA glycosylase n=1 Tax=Phytomonospora endophytica TaxID=714109 RepID=A0A841FUC1_9ACTN|nr:DNA-3-methyladenine glycosylase [Phytomonospora endophytica]GIG70112.1 hypothetical protein Pen01_64070 [Phytomonospora endophytica]